MWKGHYTQADARGQRGRKSGDLLGTRLALNSSLWPAYHGVAQEEDGDLRVVLLDGVHVLQHISDKNLKVRYHHPLSLTLPMADWKEMGKGFQCYSQVPHVCTLNPVQSSSPLITEDLKNLPRGTQLGTPANTLPGRQFSKEGGGAGSTLSKP